MIFVRFREILDLGHASTMIIKIMSILKSIWPDNLVVSLQLDIDHTYLDRISGGGGGETPFK